MSAHEDIGSFTEFGKLGRAVSKVEFCFIISGTLTACTTYSGNPLVEIIRMHIDNWHCAFDVAPHFILEDVPKFLRVYFWGRVKVRLQTEESDKLCSLVNFNHPTQQLCPRGRRLGYN